MLAKCANPECTRSFHYLHEGRLIVVREDWTAPLNGQPLEYFWLCAACAPHYEIVRLGLGKITVRKTPAPPLPLAG